MRGKNSGLETLIRDENANLLDVHGDTVHIVSNIAKEFCHPFDNYLESLANDVYYDFKLSASCNSSGVISRCLAISSCSKCATGPLDVSVL